jgi:hypothetical protein
LLPKHIEDKLVCVHISGARGFQHAGFTGREKKKNVKIYFMFAINLVFDSRSPHFHSFSLSLGKEFLLPVEIDRFSRKTLSRQSNLSVSNIKCVRGSVYLRLLRNRTEGKKHENIMLLVHFGVSFFLV